MQNNFDIWFHSIYYLEAWLFTIHDSSDSWFENHSDGSEILDDIGTGPVDEARLEGTWCWWPLETNLIRWKESDN